MYKVIYGTSNLFTLKKYDNSNLNCQSYEYPTISAIRSAILGAVIQVDGKGKAEKLFRKIKNAVIFVQYPQYFSVNGCKVKRFSNNSYNISEDSKTNRSLLTSKNFFTTIGFRQFINLHEIVFYIDLSIPKIKTYLKNIDFIGTAESFVYLKDILKTNKLKRVLNENIIQSEYEQFDWNISSSFENIYLFSSKYDIRNRRMFSCLIEDINLTI